MGMKGKKFISIIEIIAQSTGPLHIGNGDGQVLLDDDGDRAYIPATSIAGVFKSYIADNDMGETALKVFGTQDENSKIYIYDVFSMEKAIIEFRPSVQIDGRTGAGYKGGLFFQEFIGGGNLFTFRFKLFAKDEDEKKLLEVTLYKCVNALNERHIAIGGLKTSGAGQFKINRASQVDYNLLEPKDLIAYIKGNKTEENDIKKKIEGTRLNDHVALFRLKGKLKTPLLIKGQDTYEYNLPDGINIKNAQNQYIIPGTSLKGALRNHLSKILHYLGKEELLEKAFGDEVSSKVSSKVSREEVRHCGHITVSDTTILNQSTIDNKDLVNYYKIKIDKFTGGVIKGALMEEQPILGEVELIISYKTSGHPKLDDAIVGLLCLGLRDLAMENFALGSGNSIGRGKLNCSEMTLTYKGKDDVFDFVQRTITDKNHIDMLIKALNEYVEEEIKK